MRSVEFGVWSLEFGVWSLEFGVWSSECGVWSSEFGVRSSEFGVWSSEFGVWSSEFGITFLLSALLYALWKALAVPSRLAWSDSLRHHHARVRSSFARMYPRFDDPLLDGALRGPCTTVHVIFLYSKVAPNQPAPSMSTRQCCARADGWAGVCRHERGRRGAHGPPHLLSARPGPHPRPPAPHADRLGAHLVERGVAARAAPRRLLRACARACWRRGEGADGELPKQGGGQGSGSDNEPVARAGRHEAHVVERGLAA